MWAQQASTHRDLSDTDVGRGRTISALTEIFSDVLGRRVEPDQDILSAGADSLAITRIVSRLVGDLGADVTIRQVFDHPSASDLAPHLRSRRATAERVVEPDTDVQPSHSQERMWFLHQMDEFGSSYNVEHTVRIAGPVDADRFRAAIDLLTERHPMLRSAYRSAPAGLRVDVHDRARVDVALVELTGAADPLSDARLDVERLTAEPFDLGRPPLLRARLYRLADDDHVVCFCAHHIVCDQWGMGVLVGELRALYERGAEALSTGGVPADHFGHWHRTESDRRSDEGQLAHWVQRLRDLPVVAFPTDHVRGPVPNFRGSVVATPLGERTSRVQQLAAAHGATPFMVYLAAFDVVVERYTGSDDVVIGVPIANRNVAESEGLVTNLVNTVVARSDLSGDPTISELILRVRDVALDAYEHQDVPFARVAASLATERRGRTTPLFDVFLNVVNAPFEAFSVGDAVAEPLVVDRGGAQFDLSLGIDLVHTKAATIEFNTTLFERSTAEQVLADFLSVVDAFVADPQRRVASIEMVAPAAEDAGAGWCGPVRDIDDAATVHGLIGRRSQISPTAIAVVGPDRRSLTYEQLDIRSNQLANHLVGLGVRTGDLVGLQVERSVDMVVAVLGVLRSGAAYVPIDPAYPADRRRLMIEDSRLRLIIGERALVDASVTPASVTTVLLDRDADVIAREAETAPRIPVTGHDRAYVIYTSGSTGVPKGVELEHRSVVNFLEAMRRRPGLSADDTVLSVTTLSFDIAVLELFLPLLVGGTVVVADRETAMSPAALRDELLRSQATVMQATPSTWRMLVEDGWPGDPGLTILCGGEALGRDLADALVARGRVVWNMYGPTETTVWSAALPLELSPGPVPVGGPIDNTMLYVLDRLGRRCPDGVPGELFIGGDGLARGYLRRPELTAERFVPDPFRRADDAAGARVEGARMYRTGDVVRRRRDGHLDFLGRVDGQVKVRGHRIELGEIEAQLLQHPSIAEAVVVARSVADGDTRLVAYVVPAAGETYDRSSCRSFLGERLPESMIPSTVVALAALPLTPNGKVDRNALPEPQVDAVRRDAAEAPVPGIESVLAEIWTDILGVSSISRDDDFFELGGHSLLAVRMVARLRDRTEVQLPLSALFGARTIRQIARHIAAPSEPSPWTSLIPITDEGDRPPFFYVSPFLITALSFTHLAEQLGPDQPFYVLQPQGMESDAAIHDRVEDMAAHYLREIRDVQPHGPYHLGGHCAGSWVAFEMARQLQQQGETVATLMVVDAGPPGVEPPAQGRMAAALAATRYYLRSGRLVDAARWKLSVRLERWRARRTGDATQERVARLRAIHATAHRRYPGGRVEGDIVFVRSDQSTHVAALDWQLRWRDVVSGELSVAVVPGAHSALVELASSRSLAGHIRAAMDGHRPRTA